MSLIRSLSGILFFGLLLQFVIAYDMPSLEKRQCVSCPSTPPPCPVCPEGQECTITSQSCTQCAQSVCIAASQVGIAPSATPAPSGPNTGAIAGGIVGAFVLVVCVAGVMFWYVRKKKRAVEDMDEWLDKTEHPTEDDEKDLTLHPHDSHVMYSHHSIASTTMTQASNVIPIGYIPSPLRNTMMSGDTGYTGHDSMSTLPSPRSHPPTQFFSADDILRTSVASNNRDTRYSDRDTMYSDFNRNSVATTYTRASVTTTGCLAAAPVPFMVKAQAKMVKVGKSPQPSPIPAVPELTAEKVANAERTRATSSMPAPNPAPTLPTTAGSTPAQTRGSLNPTGKKETRSLELNIPVALPAGPDGTKRASSVIGDRIPSHFDELPESAILGETESSTSTPEPPIMQDFPVILTPTSSTMPDDARASRTSSRLVDIQKHD